MISLSTALLRRERWKGILGWSEFSRGLLLAWDEKETILGVRSKDIARSVLEVRWGVTLEAHNPQIGQNAFPCLGVDLMLFARARGMNTAHSSQAQRRTESPGLY